MERHIRHGFADLSTAATTAANALKNKFNAISLKLKSFRHKSKYMPTEVELCLLICSLFPDDSRIPIGDLVMHLMGLKLVEDAADVFAARCRAIELISIINGLKYTRKVLRSKIKVTHEKDGPYDQCVKMLVGARDLTKMAPLSCPLQFSIQTIQEKWPQAIPIDFFEGMKKLCILSLDIPSIPQSLNVPKNLTTLRIKVIKLEDMSWIGGLTSLEFLSISTSSLTNLPREMGDLEKLRFLDLKNVNLAHIPAGIFSRMLKLEELYLPLSFERWGCMAKQLDDYDEWESGGEDDEEKINAITSEMKATVKINASLGEMVSPSLHALHISISNASVLPKKSPIFKNIRHFKVRVPKYAIYQLLDEDSSNELHLTGDTCDIKESGICDLMSRTEAMSLMRVKNLKNSMYFLENTNLPLLRRMIISEWEELDYVVDAREKQIPSEENYLLWKLESLHLSKLHNLKEICNDRWQTFRWFSNLRELSIRFCHKLKYVFPVSLLRRQILLKDIEILDCSEMEGVFYEVEEVDSPLTLSCIENLDLHSLPNFIGFSIPKDGKIGGVHDAANQSLTTNEVPSVINRDEFIIPKDMYRVFSSKLEGKWLPDLKRLKIAFCDSVAIIFFFDENYAASKVFISLKELELYGLRNLVHIWSQVPRKTSAFQNLQFLALFECSNAYVFSYQVAKLLVQLQKVSISRCERIIEIILRDNEEREGGVVLPRLKLLEVQHIPNLTILFGGSYKRELPSLESLKLNQCNKVKSIGYGLLRMPMLDGIEVNGSFLLLTKDHGAIFTGVTTLHSFELADLKIATKRFSLGNLVGEGSFAQVYKGWIDRKTYAPSKTSTGMPVAVKRYKTYDYKNAKEQWMSEVDILQKKLHPNLIKLLGYCSEVGELLVVYEMIPQGSLHDHLFARNSGIKPLSWDMRIKIAIGVARGLHFLHTSTPQVIHRDIKPSNILFDTDYSSRIADFGLAISGPSNAGSHETTMNYNSDRSHWSTLTVGTIGYMDPDYVTSGRATVENDVYSFGVVLLQLMTGLKAIDYDHPEEQRELVTRLKPILSLERALRGMMDSTLEGQYTTKAMLLMAELASNCIDSDPTRRPTMGQVIQELHRVQDFYSSGVNLIGTRNPHEVEMRFLNPPNLETCNRGR